MIGKDAKAAASPRALLMKERLLTRPYEVDIERPRYLTEAWREHAKDGPCTRTARAFEAVCQRMTIRIDEDELLVGVKTGKEVSVLLDLERGSFIDFSSICRTTDSSKPKEYRISEPDYRELQYRILPYWKGRSVHDVKLARWIAQGAYRENPSPKPRELRAIVQGFGGVRNTLRVINKAIEGNWKSLTQLRKLTMAADLLPDLHLLVLDMQGHTVPGYNRVMEIGFDGIAGLARLTAEGLDGSDPDQARRADFLASVQVVCDAVRDYSNRYADLAEKKASTAQGARREELLDIAQRCRRVPMEPPTGFMEAMQSLWMTQVVLSLSYGVPEVLSPGRVDQYLYPFYEADLEAGRITREQALEAIEEYFVKIANVLLPPILFANSKGQGLAGSNNLTLGGVDREGNDATNEISYLFLDALEHIKALSNNLSVRISEKTPPEFLLRTAEIHRAGAGVAFYNDKVIVNELMKDGYSLEDARDYSIVGCVEPTSTGNCFSYTAGNVVLLLSVLEQALNEGCTMMTGWRRVGAPTPPASSFESFEDLQDAFVEQLEFNVSKLVRLAELKDRVYSESFPSPVLSATIAGCAESGFDVTQGGARYNHGHVNAQALATVADSLTAIKWAVFDRKMITMEGLLAHLRTSFKDAEPLRQQLLCKAPKYGNDDPEADAMADWVMKVFCDVVRKHRSWRGGIYRPSMFSSGTQTVEGFLCGASADGRKAGDPVSNGVSPTNGMERAGTTAVMISASRSGKALLSDGTALNMRLSPFLLSSDENVQKLAHLVKAYFEIGGRHVQFTPLDTATLRDAQAHPEKYYDLVVKVSGYSAHFIDLPKQLQDDIIARTEFEV